MQAGCRLSATLHELMSRPLSIWMGLLRVMCWCSSPSPVHAPHAHPSWLPSASLVLRVLLQVLQAQLCLHLLHRQEHLREQSQETVNGKLTQPGLQHAWNHEAVAQLQVRTILVAGLVYVLILPLPACCAHGGDIRSEPTAWATAAFVTGCCCAPDCFCCTH